MLSSKVQYISPLSVNIFLEQSHSKERIVEVSQVDIVTAQLHILLQVIVQFVEDAPRK